MKYDERDLVAVIMAGGVGTRFWPLSTGERPKQFLKLFDEKSLLQKSFDRISDMIPGDRIMVLTNRDFVNLVKEQLPQIPKRNIVGEPFRRDTAAAVCLGAALCRKRFGNPVIITLTADHMIEPVDLFQKSLISAVRMARETGSLYTFGIEPTYPATGYGYLEMGAKVAFDEDIGHFRLLGFKEKPDTRTANRYVRSGRYCWNSGMFVWSTDSILKEVERQIPDHLKAMTEAVGFDGKPDWPEALEKAFENLPAISIDYAVMEKAQDVRCIRCTFSWTDVGGWNALRDFFPKDTAGNTFRGHIMPSDSEGNFIFCTNKDETVMLIGVKDLIVVRAENNTLIVHKDRTEDIKKLVQEHFM